MTRMRNHRCSTQPRRRLQPQVEGANGECGSLPLLPLPWALQLVARPSQVRPPQRHRFQARPRVHHSLDVRRTEAAAHRPPQSAS